MKNKIIYLLLLVVLFEGLFFAFKPNLGSIRTDSGWDSDYSSDSGSDWSSSSSDWDYDSSSSSSSSGGGSSEFTLGTAIFLEIFLSIFYFAILSTVLPDKTVLNIFINLIRLAIMITLEATVSKNLAFLSFCFFFPIVFILPVLGSRKSSNSTSVSHSFNDVSIDKLEKYGITDLEALKKELYDLFVDVQKAWMEFDYDALAKLCGNELYNSYKSDLETLKLKNGKNIMDSFKLIDCKIYNIFSSNNGYNLNVYMKVQFHDYVINTKTNKVIRGTKDKMFNNEYKLTFRKNDIKLDKCPSCGAPIKDTSSQKCDHCGNTIVNNNVNYVLEKKGRL